MVDVTYPEYPTDAGGWVLLSEINEGYSIGVCEKQRVNDGNDRQGKKIGVENIRAMGRRSYTRVIRVAVISNCSVRGILIQRGEYNLKNKENKKKA